MTEDDWDKHNAADKCWICDGPFKPYSKATPAVYGKSVIMIT